MAGKNQISQFKESFGAESVFIGGNIDPNTIGIVGLPPTHPLFISGIDIPLEDWNADLWDAARLSMALTDPIDPEKFLLTVEMGGSIPPVKVTRRRDLILAVDGRRKTLAARAANKLLLKRGESVDGLIEIPAIVDKSSDLEVSVRVANEGSLNEPPWIKAANAARLKGRGKSEEQIQAIFGVEMSTITSWLTYAECLSPLIKAQIEQGPKGERIPFSVGVELAKGSGRGEEKAQCDALQYLRQTDAKLTGEKGRENAKNVIRSFMSGDTPDDAITSVPPSEEQDITPLKTPTGPTTGPKPPRSPVVATQMPKLSWAAIREIAAHLEASPADPHTTEGERVANAILQVLTGADPTGESLAPWPKIQAKFRKVVRSPVVADPGFKMIEKACPSCGGKKVNSATKKPCSTCTATGVIKVKAPSK